MITLILWNVLLKQFIMQYTVSSGLNIVTAIYKTLKFLHWERAPSLLVSFWRYLNYC